MLRASILSAALVLVTSIAFADDTTLDLKIGDFTVAKTVITPYDDSSKESREATYKVYTHVMDFAGKEPITKGSDGLYTHHRGMFIGWRETTVGDKKFDTWHMTDYYQESEPNPVRWSAQLSIDSEYIAYGGQGFKIKWRGNDGTRILDEDRSISAGITKDGTRVLDHSSRLTAGDQPVTLRGDSHHAGMQIRLSNDVSEHQNTTKYIAQPGAEFLKNDEVNGTWWVACAADIGGKRYWVMHMTPQDHPGGQPLYSIRPYARFGAFFEPDLKAGQTLDVHFRIVVSESEITSERAAELYAAFREDSE